MRMLRRSAVIQSYISAYKAVSVCILVYQSVSVCISLYQSVSVCISLYQSVSVGISLYQSVSVCISLYQLYQSVSIVSVCISVLGKYCRHSEQCTVKSVSTIGIYYVVIIIEVKSSTSTMWNVVGAERTSTGPNRILSHKQMACSSAWNTACLQLEARSVS
jgi:hypothetical protein